MNKIMFSFEPASSEDLPWLFDLHKATLKVYVEKLWGWDETWQRDHFFTTCNLDNSKLITTEDRPIGRLTVVHKSDHIFLAYIAILPSFQNRGIGTEIVRGVVDEAQAVNKPVVLTALNTNPVMSLYEKLGFIFKEKDDFRTTFVHS